MPAKKLTRENIKFAVLINEELGSVFVEAILQGPNGEPLHADLRGTFGAAWDEKFQCSMSTEAFGLFQKQFDDMATNAMSDLQEKLNEIVDIYKEDPV